MEDKKWLAAGGKNRYLLILWRGPSDLKGRQLLTGLRALKDAKTILAN
jgi:hypothetical protein